MTMLSKRALTLMVLVLMAATAATAATALAGEKKRIRPAQHAVESVNSTSQHMLRTKVRNIQAFQTHGNLLRVKR